MQFILIVLKEYLILNGGELEGLEQFCYQRDVIDCETEVERAVTMRVAETQGKWKEMVSLSTN